MSETIRLGIVGFGKIAQDQHVAAIAQCPGIDLIATADPQRRAAGLPAYLDTAAMLTGEPELNAVTLCMPPQARFAAARSALEAGLHVFLEKPPGATVCEVEALIALAAKQRVTLFAAWHSREGAAVAAAKTWLAERAILRIDVSWKEDVRVWHPGQRWIWEPGGFGVFDPGINALSIVTHILPEPLRLVSAELTTPENCAAPIAADLVLETASGQPVSAAFDFRHSGAPGWDIRVATAAGELLLSDGGNRLAIAGMPQTLPEKAEYPRLYRRFTDLIRAGQSEVDLAPMRLVADAFLLGRNRLTDPFFD